MGINNLVRICGVLHVTQTKPRNFRNLNADMASAIFSCSVACFIYLWILNCRQVNNFGIVSVMPPPPIPREVQPPLQPSWSHADNRRRGSLAQVCFLLIQRFSQIVLHASLFMVKCVVWKMFECKCRRRLSHRRS